MNKTTIHALTICIKHITEKKLLEVLARIGRKRNKRYPDRKREEKYLFPADMINCGERPEDSAKILLELMNEFRKVARYITNM